MSVVSVNSSSPENETWNHTTPVEFSPLFNWPPNPRSLFLGLTKRWVTLTRNVLFLLMAWLVYRYALPETSAMTSLSANWVLSVFGRNMLFMTVIAGGLHLYLFTFRAQGKKLKYDSRETQEKGRPFFFKNQVWDNAFWSLASGTTIWSLYEVAYLWGYANKVLPDFAITAKPWLFAAWLLLLPVLTSSHFYFAHRFLHWPPLYKRVHRVHHRNIHIGPWSGMSMHPVEHVLYISSVLIHLVVPSHPVVVLLHLYSRCLGPAFSHSGFEKLLIKEKAIFDAADFHHQLHHRFFECNYGTVDAPWDWWFGSYHDGSDQATARVREQRRRLHRGRTSA